ncbi:MAG: metallophosphatase family protein [Chromatiales bacterium]|nr:metallophosphatase family protein [Chromatiales bacterium]
MRGLLRGPYWAVSRDPGKRRRSTVRIIGVISDTHGLLRPEALAALEGSELILHAGDVGDLRILDELARIAPVHAVYGNTDWGEVRGRLPRTVEWIWGPRTGRWLPTRWGPSPTSTTATGSWSWTRLPPGLRLW